MSASLRIAVVKILPHKYLADFLEGNLYLNTLSYFAGIEESDPVRGDCHEGAIESRQVTGVAIQDTNGTWLPITGVQNPVVLSGGSMRDINVLCAYMVTDIVEDRFDIRNLEFGDTAVVITNLPLFLDRVKKAASAKDWQVAHGPVTYVDPSTHDGAMGPFRKFSRLSYQREFRIVLRTKERQACRLDIGDLGDITFVIPSGQIQAFWERERGCLTHR